MSVKQERLLLGAIIALTCAAYAPSLTADFVRDDWIVLLRARSIPLIEEFNPFFSGHLEHLRSIQKALFEVMGFLFAPNPLPYHMLSLALHLVSVALLFSFATKYRNRETALVATLLFALNPAASEAVISPAAAATPLATVFALASLNALYAKSKPMRILGTVFALLAYFTHEAAAPLVAVVFIVLVTEKRLRENRRLMIAHCVAAAAFVAMWFAGPMGFNKTLAAGSWKIGVHGVFHMIEYFISLVFYPGLFLYPHGEGWLGFLREPMWLHVAVDLVFAAMFIEFVRRVMRKQAPLLVCAALFLTPVVFFVWGNSSRYLHLPSAMFAVALASAAVDAKLFSGPRQNAALAIIAALALGFAGNVVFESMDQRKEGEFASRELAKINASIEPGVKEVNLGECPMHPDHIEAALRVIRDDLKIEVSCGGVVRHPFAPPRR